jgi:hypothetical protein
MGDLVGPLPAEIFDVPASEIPAIHEKVKEAQQLPAFNNPKGLPNGKYRLEWNQKKSLEAQGPEIDPDIWFRTKVCVAARSRVETCADLEYSH